MTFVAAKFQRVAATAAARICAYTVGGKRFGDAFVNFLSAHVSDGGAEAFSNSRKEIMSISHYGRILQNLTSAYDEMQKVREVDYPRKAELASYFISMSIDATQNVVRSKLGYNDPQLAILESSSNDGEASRDEPFDDVA